jgi:hypothetical protein
MKKSQEFLAIAKQVAGERKKHTFLRSLLIEADDEYGVCQNAIKELLNQKNWTVQSRPRVVVSGRLNQSGNFTVRWYPTASYGSTVERVGQIVVDDRSDLEFDEAFLGRCWWTEAAGGSPYRPANELMWFRGASGLSPAVFEEHADILAPLSFGLKARYEELLDDIGQQVQITNATSFVVKMENDLLSDWDLAEAGE